MLRAFLVSCLVLGLLGCGAGSEPPPAGMAWAIAIHGGAGVLPDSLGEDQKRLRLSALEQALELGRTILDEGGTSLDAVERVIRLLEDDPLFNAGKGAVFNHAGDNELDASIMDGRDLSCGAVAGVRTVKNPITLARLVMERTPHVLLAADGAEAFADEMQVERVEPDYFFTEERWESLQRALGRESRAPGGGTVGAVALDRDGNLAAGTSTGGLTNKRFGRVGDSPIIGAGTYADNRSCAVSATGRGEEFIRHGVARMICALMEAGDRSLQQSADLVIGEWLKPGDGGVIALSRTGEIALDFNTEGMYRAAADSSGRSEVAIGP